MSQKSVELILLRQLTGYLATPFFIVNKQNALIFFNEAAEEILGLKFSETGEMSTHEWLTLFSPANQSGSLSIKELPVYKALHSGKPEGGNCYISNIHKQKKYVSIFAFPLITQADETLGAAAIFWEVAP